MLIPDTVKAVEQAKTEIRLAEEEELINFYSKALSLLPVLCVGMDIRV